MIEIVAAAHDINLNEKAAHDAPPLTFADDRG
jgi:hypothetical protein